jgi:hypothetical protein
MSLVSRVLEKKPDPVGRRPRETILMPRSRVKLTPSKEFLRLMYLRRDHVMIYEPFV